jgi:hypothetical protein
LNTVGGRFLIRGVDVTEIILGIIFVCGLTVDNNSALLVDDTGAETECLLFENELLWLVEMLLVLVSCAFELGADDGDGLGVLLGKDQAVLEPFFIRGLEHVGVDNLVPLIRWINYQFRN